jgi:hypothetical protein
MAAIHWRAKGESVAGQALCSVLPIAPPMPAVCSAARRKMDRTLDPEDPAAAIARSFPFQIPYEPDRPYSWHRACA